MATFGKVHDVTTEFHFEWHIDDFFSLPENDGEFCESPSFSFAGESWCFKIYNNSAGYIGVFLGRKLEGPPISVAWSLGVKTFEGKTEHERQSTHVFKKAEAVGNPKFLKQSDLSEKKTELMPSDVLTLVCHIDHYSKPKDGAGDTETAKCSHCKKTFDAKYISSHEEKCLDKPIKCPTCGNVVALKEWYDHACDTAIRVRATEKLLDDLAGILESAELSDITIRVKGKEFRLHRSILAARSPYYSSMFKTDMKEKNTGIVSIDDCEPDTFQSFINFIYTGKVDTLSCHNVCALYEVADKYQEEQLKEECLCYIKNEMSVGSFVDFFVDFILLALKHDEKELLQIATDLFCRKTKKIVQSVKWQTFLRDNPTQANELFLKAVDYLTK